MADRFASRGYSLKNKLGDRMIKQLLNSVIAKYCYLSVSRRSIICLSLPLRQIINLLTTDKSRYFAQPRPIIANYYYYYCYYNSTYLQLISLKQKKLFGQSTIYKSFHLISSCSFRLKKKFISDLRREFLRSFLTDVISRGNKWCLCETSAVFSR